MRKARPVESFFNFFSPPVPPPSDVENDEIDEEELAELDNSLALDYQIGDDFKDRVRISASCHRHPVRITVIYRSFRTQSITSLEELSSGMAKSGRAVTRTTRKTTTMKVRRMMRRMTYVRFCLLSCIPDLIPPLIQDADPRLRAPPKNGAQNEDCKTQ